MNNNELFFAVILIVVVGSVVKTWIKARTFKSMVEKSDDATFREMFRKPRCTCGPNQACSDC